MSVECCPVCGGKGKVPNGFYNAIGVNNYCTASIAPEICRSCNGTGIVSGFINVFNNENEKIKELEERIEKLESKVSTTQVKLGGISPNLR